MQWRLTQEQDDYRDALTGWLADTAPADVRRGWLDTGDRAAFAKAFTSAGWAGVGLGEELGGQGGGMVELALTAECLAAAAVPSGAWLATALAAPATEGRPEAGEWVSELALALLVPSEGAPDAAPTVRVDADGRLTGAVSRVLAGDGAGRLVVPALDGARLGLWLVEASAAGVERRPRALLDRTRSVADVTLTGAPGARLTVDAERFLAQAAARAAVLVSADTLGASQAMLDLAVEYSRQRHQFGVPIGSFQAVKHAAATMLVGIEAARSVVYYAAASVESGHEQSMLHAAAAKAQVTAEGVRAADSALTLHGAIGYTWEHDLHLFYKRAKLNQPLFGSPSAWNERIAAGLELG